ncbi:unnamed protein product [Closterium sp. Yama58-4]|nr:unnamed protein product [Closterium sp. Yama58-4]
MAKGMLWFLLVCVFVAIARVDSSIPAIFTFGDSTADVGENNYLPFSTFKANFLPYGIDYIPMSGRFSDGRLVGDFLAQYVGLNPAPPLHQPKANFSTGVNFASGGATIEKVSNPFQSIGLSRQALEFTLFSNISLLNRQVDALTKSLFFFSAGANDIIAYLYAFPLSGSFLFDPLTFSISIQRLYSLGARRFLIAGVGPIGCTPSVMVYTQATNCSRDDSVNVLAAAFNMVLNQTLIDIQQNSLLPNATLLFANPYDLVLGASINPGSYGFKVGIGACCGQGKLNAEDWCGQNGTDVCSAPQDYVYWDGLHPTQAIGHVRVVAAAGIGSSSGDAASGGETVKELKQRLLRAVGGTQRGKAASPQQREQILQLIERLEAANPTPSPMLSPLLGGTWALVYIAPTAASANTLDASEEGPFLARLKPVVFGGVRQKASLQIILPDEGRAENVALFTAWGVDGELRIDAECKAPEQESMRGVRSTVRFLSFKLSLGPLSFTLPLSLISPTGWIDVTYIDEEMRVTRGDKGSVFLATRVKA